MTTNNSKLGTLGQQLMAKADKNTKEFLKRSMVPNPTNDGKTHINLSNRSATKLGRILSSGDHPFTIPELGHFSSLESFMLFILSKEVDITYPGLPYAKAVRKRMRITPQYNATHAEFLKDALRHILKRSKMLRDLFLKNNLPFDCYFMPKDSKFPRRPRSADLWIKIINELKAEFSGRNQAVVRPDYSEILKRIESVTEPVATQQEKTEVVEEEHTHELHYEEAGETDTVDGPITDEVETEAIIDAVMNGELHTTIDNDLVETAAEDLRVEEPLCESETETTQSIPVETN